MSVALSGNGLTFLQLYDVALHSEQVQLTASTIERMNASRAVVDRLVASGAAAYGINTGFGKLASVRISTEQVRQLQLSLRHNDYGTFDPGRDDGVFDELDYLLQRNRRLCCVNDSFELSF